MYDYDCRTGKEVVEQYRDIRHRKAVRLQELRKAAPALLPSLSVNKRNEFIRRVVSDEFRYLPFTPTTRNFWEEMKAQFRYSCEPIPHCGNEYYSACGMEDYYGECRDHARNTAIEYFRAWAYLKGFGDEVGQTEGGRI